MNSLIKRFGSGLMALVLVLSLFVGALPVGTFAATGSYTYNTGTRHDYNVQLSSQAEAYYTGNYTWEQLSALQGSNGDCLDMDTPMFEALNSLMSSTMTMSYSYSSLPDYWEYSDASKGSSGTIWFYIDDTTSSGTMSREHVWPKSHASFKEKNGGADLHHLRPSISDINSSRGNLIMGNVRGTSGAKTYSYGGKAVLYKTSTHVEVNDNIKGDVARIFLYVWCRWEEPNLFKNVSNPVIGPNDDANDGGKVIESLETLLEWCELDPVDTWEMSRNDQVERMQGNRNVFIDYPEFAWLIFNQDVPAGYNTPSGNGGSSSAPDCDVHSYVATVTAPTCTEAGYTTYKCSACGHCYTGSSVAATGHKWVAATCTTPKTCSVCHAIEGSTAVHADANSDNFCDTCGTSMGTTTPPAVTGNTYIKVTTAPSDWTGQYLIVYEDGALALDGSLTEFDAEGNSFAVSINNGRIVLDASNDHGYFIVTPATDGYAIRSASGYYIGNTSNSNDLLFSKTTSYSNTLSMDSNESVSVLSSGGSYLRYNDNAYNGTRFRYYKSSSYNNQQPISFYKLCEHSWIAATCTTPKTCSVCGATEGAASHNVVNEICTVCGKYGTCGENLTWTLNDEGTLTISGTGAMTSYASKDKTPWHTLRSDILNVVIEDGVTGISPFAFQNCSALTSVTIPESVSSIGGQAFEYASQLNAVYISDLGTWCEIAFNGNSANPLFYADNLYVNNVLVTDLVIPEGTSIISDYAFYDFDGAASVTVPASVTSIGNKAFYGCGKLTEVTICGGVTTIGEQAFGYSPKLARILLPKELTTIGTNAFNGCTSLSDVYYQGGQTDWDNITVGKYNTKLTGAAILRNYPKTTLPAVCSHNWNVATCTSAKSCTACGATKGNALGHSAPEQTDCTVAVNCTVCGVEVHAAKDHTYTDEADTDCNVCGAVREVKPSWTVGGFDNSSNNLSLLLESEVFINLKLKVTGIEGIDPAELVNYMKLGVFYTKTANASDSTLATADVVMDKVTYDAATGYYSFQSNGIPAKNMGDSRWYIAFITLPDGTVVRSGRFEYSPKKYAQAAMTNASFGDDLKALCVGLMNYGAAAQVYFAEKTDYTYTELMNVGFDSYQHLVRSYDASMITDRVPNTKELEFENANTNFTGAPVFSLSLEGAIDMNFTYTAAKSGTITAAGMMIWDAETYGQVEKLTLENATEVVYVEEEDLGSKFKLSYAGTPAKEMGDTVYVVGFYEIDGTTYYSGVVTRSIEYYANNEINSTTSVESLKETMKAMVVYGDHAKDYFAKN